MNVFTGKPAYQIIAPEDEPPLIPEYLIPSVCIDIAIAHPYLLRGEVIASNVPLQPLKDATLAILKHLSIDGTCIVLPRSEAIDNNLLVNLVTLITDQHRAGVAIDLDIPALPQEPVKLIKLHVLLGLFGLETLAHTLFIHLWSVFESHSLALVEVFWIWDALGPDQDAMWIPTTAGAYLQMMAWSILKADAEGRLDADLRMFFVEMEGEPYHLTRLLERERRFDTYGLEREKRQVVGSGSRRRCDSAIGQADDVAVPVDECMRDCTSRVQLPLAVSSDLHSGYTIVSNSLQVPRKDSLTAPSVGSIFPARWLRAPHYGRIEPPCLHDEQGDKGNKVKRMVAERDALVRLRRSKVSEKTAFGPPVYTEFGYVGWCDRKRK